MLDKLLKKYEYIYKGIVLDIGGRDRGKFTKPKHKVDKWIFADIEEKHHPDILLDIANMHMIDDESIDIVSAMEVFEHVEKIEKGISECYRVLRKGGKLILSAPFLYPVHADPFDFQRWTLVKWKKELTGIGFNIETIKINGRFFTVTNSFKKDLILSLPLILRHIAYLYLPIFDLINKLDNTKMIKNHKKLGNYHGGYFIIAEK
jgi:SAM-dependent methyltransferase